MEILDREDGDTPISGTVPSCMDWHLFGWPRLKAPWGAAVVVQERGEKSAEAHHIDEYYLPALGATERDPELHMLWSHCQRAQITPEAIKADEASPS